MDRDNRCVVKVGEGRGFIIKQRVKLFRPEGLPAHIKLRTYTERRLVVTAAHCLPTLLFPSDPTHNNILGRLNDDKTTVWAQCLFIDPIADVAVLGSPDSQELCDPADAYEALTENASVLRVGRARSGRGWVLALDGRWTPTVLKVFRGTWGESLSIDPTEAGMSGSPILNRAGLAVAVVSMGMETVKDGRRTNERCGPQPILARSLPGWLLDR